MAILNIFQIGNLIKELQNSLASYSPSFLERFKIGTLNFFRIILFLPTIKMPPSKNTLRELLKTLKIIEDEGIDLLHEISNQENLVKNLQTKKSNIEKEIITIEESIKLLDSKITELLQKRESTFDTTEKINSLKHKLSDFKAEKSKVELEIKTLETQSKSLEDKLNELSQELFDFIHDNFEKYLGKEDIAKQKSNSIASVFFKIAVKFYGYLGIEPAVIEQTVVVNNKQESLDEKGLEKAKNDRDRRLAKFFIQNKTYMVKEEKISDNVYKGIFKNLSHINNAPDKTLAIKKFPKDVYFQDQNQAIVEHEFSLQSGLSADNNTYIVKAMEYNTFIEIPYILMEYSPYGTLMQWMENENTASNRPVFSAEHINSVLLNISQGVDYIHKHHIIHGDLKPQNMLVFIDSGTNTIHIKITDFGQSFKKGSTIDYKPGNGTSAYIAPELFILGNIPTEYTDTFAMTLVFCNLISGKHPAIEEIVKLNTPPTSESSNNNYGPYKEIVQTGLLIFSPKERPSAQETVKSIVKIQSETKENGIAPGKYDKKSFETAERADSKYYEETWNGVLNKKQ